MCGIVGVFGKIEPHHIQMFHDMWDMDVLRGKDSAGIIVITTNGVDILKDTVLPYELRLYYKDYDKLFKRKGNQRIIGLLGHNRFSTRGAISVENAHPFIHGDITLMHNGTCFTWRLPDDNKFDTDSESICHAINQIGIEKTYPLIDGALTLAFWDNKDKTFNLVSNGKRPMNFVYSEDKHTIFLASEHWMLFSAAARHNQPLYSTKTTAWYTLTDNRLYSFDYNNKDGITYGTTDLKAYFEPVKTTHSNSSYRGRLKYDSVLGEWVDKDTKEVIKENNVIPFKPANNTNTTHSKLTAPVPLHKINPRNKTISRKDYELYYDVCCGCHRGIKDQYVESVILNYENCEALCKTCVEIGESNNIVIDKQLATVH